MDSYHNEVNDHKMLILIEAVNHSRAEGVCYALCSPTPCPIGRTMKGNAELVSHLYLLSVKASGTLEFNGVISLSVLAGF